MTLNAHRRRDLKRTRRTRVWLDGEEVTHRCWYADGRRGVVRLYAKGSQGGFNIVDGKIQSVELRGKVRWGRFP